MTFKFEADYYVPVKSLEKELQLYVVGSKAGHLKSNPSVSAQIHKWNPRFKIECAFDDNLIFTLFAL